MSSISNVANFKCFYISGWSYFFTFFFHKTKRNIANINITNQPTKQQPNLKNNLNLKKMNYDFINHCFSSLVKSQHIFWFHNHCNPQIPGVGGEQPTSILLWDQETNTNSMFLSLSIFTVGCFWKGAARPDFPLLETLQLTTKQQIPEREIGQGGYWG